MIKHASSLTRMMLIVSIKEIRKKKIWRTFCTESSNSSLFFILCHITKFPCDSVSTGHPLLHTAAQFTQQLSSCYHCCQLLFLPPDSAFLEMRAKIWICYWYTVDLFGFNFIHISEQKGTVQNYANPIFANPHLFMYKIITGCFTKKAKLGW